MTWRSCSLDGCHSIVVQATALKRQRYLVCSSIWSTTDLFPSWPKAASTWMLSVALGVCIRHCLVGGTCSVQSLDHIYFLQALMKLQCFSSKKEKKMLLGYKGNPFFNEGTGKIRRKMDQFIKGQKTQHLPSPFSFLTRINIFFPCFLDRHSSVDKHWPQTKQLSFSP